MGVLDPADALLVLFALFLVGGIAAIFFTRFARKREYQKHRKISRGKRQTNTSYDLFNPDEAPGKASTRESRQGKRRRSATPTIDILARDDDTPDRSE